MDPDQQVVAGPDTQVVAGPDKPVVAGPDKPVVAPAPVLQRSSAASPVPAGGGSGPVQALRGPSGADGDAARPARPRAGLGAPLPEIPKPAAPTPPRPSHDPLPRTGPATTTVPTPAGPPAVSRSAVPGTATEPRPSVTAPVQRAASTDAVSPAEPAGRDSAQRPVAPPARAAAAAHPPGPEPVGPARRQPEPITPPPPTPRPVTDPPAAPEPLTPPPVAPRPVHPGPRSTPVQRSPGRPARIRDRATDAAPRPTVTWRPAHPAPPRTGTAVPGTADSGTVGHDVLRSDAHPRSPHDSRRGRSPAGLLAPAPSAQTSGGAEHTPQPQATSRTPTVQRALANRPEATPPRPANGHGTTRPTLANRHEAMYPVLANRDGTSAVQQDGRGAGGTAARRDPAPVVQRNPAPERQPTEPSAGTRPPDDPKRTADPGQRPGVTQRPSENSGRATVEELTDRHVILLAERLVAKLTREQVDRLAHRLFDPMQRLLRADMRSSRERSARLRDGWR